MAQKSLPPGRVRSSCVYSYRKGRQKRRAAVPERVFESGVASVIPRSPSQVFPKLCWQTVFRNPLRQSASEAWPGVGYISFKRISTKRCGALSRIGPREFSFPGGLLVSPLEPWPAFPPLLSLFVCRSGLFPRCVVGHGLLKCKTAPRRVLCFGSSPSPQCGTTLYERSTGFERVCSGPHEGGNGG